MITAVKNNGNRIVAFTKNVFINEKKRTSTKKENPAFSIILRDVQKKYFLDDFELDIKSLKFDNQDIHVIIGPNGSGKSTILRLISLMEKPDQGEILFDNKPVLSGDDCSNKMRKKIGFITQKPYLFNGNVFENISLGLRIRKYSADEIVFKVERTIKDLGIKYLIKKRVSSLSSGEYQKVAIAQVLVLEPGILLMDEPTAGVDTKSILSIEETVKNIQAKFHSIVIMTTHSLSQAYRMSSDVISVNNGKIVKF